MTAQGVAINGHLPRSADALEASLMRTLGAVVGGAALTRSLGYPSQAAFRQALARNRVPIPVFCIEGRRGRFALVRDLAAWLHRLETGADNSFPTEIDTVDIGGEK